MRFRVQNIRKGYCEVWANEHDGERYQQLAVVMRDDDGSWRWSARHDKPPFFMPWYTYEFESRHECINDCKRTALKRLVERAMERQPKESQHWHSPRRDAWCDVRRHDYLFTHVELEEIDKKLKAFKEDQ